MSAFVVDREHIMYLVLAARELDSGFSWRYRGKFYSLASDGPGQSRYAADARLLEVGTMLWEENIKSVMYRYPDDTRETLPGPCGEDFKLTARDIKRNEHRPAFRYDLNPVQVLKSCNCYTYQTCEHPGWKRSQAHTFIETLKAIAIRNLAGYEDADWGWPGRVAKIESARRMASPCTN